MLNTLDGLISGMALNTRIQEIVDAGYKKSALARAAGKSPAAVTQWISGETKEIKADSAAGIQAVTGFSAVWIATGKGPKMASVSNVSAVQARKQVPLISWVQAGIWSEVQDTFAAGEADHWEDAFSSNPSDSAFALVVEGESMTSPHPGDLSFPSGTIIIVDPNRAAGPGDYVVAKDVSTQQATFKRLASDGGRWFLKPLNPAYPTIEIDDPAMRVIGRVIEYRNGGKL
jgi:SOS-response transcriptional repressor LexA